MKKAAVLTLLFLSRELCPQTVRQIAPPGTKGNKTSAREYFWLKKWKKMAQERKERKEKL